MRENKRALDAIIVEIDEKRRYLGGRQHPFINKGAATQTWKVHPIVHFGGASHRLVYLVETGLEMDFVLDPLADHVGPSLQLHAGLAGSIDEDLTKRRERIASCSADSRRIDGNLAPAENGAALRLDYGLNRPCSVVGGRPILG